MFYLKHPQHGNRHVATEQEAKQLVAAGWVRWPRTKAEKEAVPFHGEPTAPAVELVEKVILPITEQPKRRGRPPKVRQWPDQQT